MPPVLNLPTPRHVLMTTDAVGGVWRHTVDLAAGLGRAGVKVTLVSLGPPPAEDQVAEVAPLARVELKVTTLPLDWTARTAADIVVAERRLSEIARHIGADLVHLHTAALAGAGAIDRPVVAAHHSCLATWWDAVRKGPMPDDFSWRTRAVARGLRAADLVVAPSAAFADTVARRYSLPKVPEVVHNGTGVEPPVAEGRERHVLTAGRLWDEGKGTADLDAVARLLPVPLRAAGPTEGPLGAAVAPGSLAVLGRLDKAALAEERSRAGVFVSLARYEPFGLAVLEAAASGCPLVLSDIPTFRELWDGAAVFVRPGDHEAVAAALMDVLDNPERAASLSEAARSRAGRYPHDAVTSSFLRIYRRLLANASARLEAHA